MNPRDPSELINAAMAAKGMPAQSPQAQPPQAQPPRQAPPDNTQAVAGAAKKEAEAAMEKAKDSASAKDESDSMAEGPAVIKLKRGDQETEYTDSQLLGMMERYKGLNFKHSRLKPVIALAEQLLEQADPRDPEAAAKLAKVIQSSLQAQTKNPEMGGKAGNKTGNENSERRDSEPQQGDDDFDWDGWEKDNALDLPPMLKGGKVFKETNAKIDRIGSAVAQLAHMIQQAMGQGQISSQQNQQALQGAQAQVQDQRATAMRDMIGTNLTRAQEALKLPDEAAQEFLRFAGMRGYGFEDFIDPELTMEVVKDFAHSRQAPEYQRMMEQMTRRQAMAGSLDAAPTGGAGPTQGGNQFIDRMVANKRGM